MQRRTHLTRMAILFGLVYAAILLTGCSGGGSGTTSTGDAAAGGNVALFLSDGPADEYDHIWAGVKAVYLIPADDGGPVLIFKSSDPDGKEVDLLDLKDQELLLTVKKNVPAGLYSKIRLIIADIYVEGNPDTPCANGNLEIKLPSGKIDLNPRENFEVVPGETLAISLDMDMDKSIKLKEAGKSGKCIFRPVIFVDIDTVVTPDRCPRVISGTIDTLYYTDSEVTGFKLNLREGRGMLDVLLNEDTFVFDEDGAEGDSGDLEEAQNQNQLVYVRGRLKADGKFDASLVIIGEVVKLKGTVTQSEPDYFVLELDNDAGSLRVDLTADSIVFKGCDQVFDGMIPEGYTVRVLGKTEYDGVNNIYRAVAVFLQKLQPSGLLTRMEDAGGGNYWLTIELDETNSITVLLPENAIVKLSGDGIINDIDRLMQWVNCRQQGIEVQVVLDPDAPDPLTAEKLIVTPDEISDTVLGKDTGNRIIIAEEKRIAVEGKIFRVEDGQHERIEFDEIRIGEEFVAFGIEACSGDGFADFYAFLVHLGD